MRNHEFFLSIRNQNDADDWSSLVSNFGKLGLGLVSMLFNLIFMTQHYLLYSENNLVRTSSILSIQIDCDDPGKQISSHKNENHDNNNNNNKAPNSTVDCLLNGD